MHEISKELTTMREHSYLGLLLSAPVSATPPSFSSFFSLLLSPLLPDGVRDLPPPLGERERSLLGDLARGDLDWGDLSLSLGVDGGSGSALGIGEGIPSLVAGVLSGD